MWDECNLYIADYGVMEEHLRESGGRVDSQQWIF